MKLERAEVFAVTQHSRIDTITSRGSRTTSPEVFLKLTMVDGQTGWGGAAPKWYITGETQSGVVATLNERLLPWLASQDNISRATCAAMDTSVRYNYAAKTAVDMAIHDAVARSRGVPVADLLSPQAGEFFLDTFGVIFIGQSDDEAVEQASNALAGGCTRLKIKAGSDGYAAAARAARIREAVGANVHLSVDANQAWDFQCAVDIAEDLSAVVDEIEQPLQADDLRGHAALREKLAVRLVVDESVTSLRECREVIAADAADGFVLKVAKVGGVEACRQIAEVAADAGLYCVAGATLESALIEAATAHAYFGLANITRHEVKLLVKDDVATGFIARDGGLELPREPGWGVQVDESRLGQPVCIYRAGDAHA